MIFITSVINTLKLLYIIYNYKKVNRDILANILDVKRRTISRYIKNVNNELPGMYIYYNQSKKQYEIDINTEEYKYYKSLALREDERGPGRGKGKEWTGQKLNRLAELCKQGLSDADIAERFNVTQSAITQMRLRIGLKKKDLPQQEKWNTEDIKELIKLYSKKKDVEEIAKIMGRTKSSIEHKIIRLELHDIF